MKKPKNSCVAKRAKKQKYTPLPGKKYVQLHGIFSWSAPGMIICIGSVISMTDKNISVKIIDKNKLEIRMNVNLFGVTSCSQCGSPYELIGNEITCIKCGNVDFVYSDDNE